MKEIFVHLCMFFYFLGQSCGCPGSMYLQDGKYRLVKRLEFGEKVPCYGDYEQCVYTKGHSFFCINGPLPNSSPQFGISSNRVQNPRYVSTKVDEHYSNVKEIITNTTFGSGGDKRFKFDLTGSNEKMKLALYYLEIEVNDNIL